MILVENSPESVQEALREAAMRRYWRQLEASDPFDEEDEEDDDDDDDDD